MTGVALVAVGILAGGGIGLVVGFVFGWIGRQAEVDSLNELAVTLLTRADVLEGKIPAEAGYITEEPGALEDLVETPAPRPPGFRASGRGKGPRSR